MKNRKILYIFVLNFFVLTIIFFPVPMFAAGNCDVCSGPGDSSCIDYSQNPAVPGTCWHNPAKPAGVWECGPCGGGGSTLPVPTCNKTIKIQNYYDPSAPWVANDYMAIYVYGVTDVPSGDSSAGVTFNVRTEYLGANDNGVYDKWAPSGNTDGWVDDLGGGTWRVVFNWRKHTRFPGDGGLQIRSMVYMYNKDNPTKWPDTFCNGILFDVNAPTASFKVTGEAQSTRVYNYNIGDTSNGSQPALNFDATAYSSTALPQLVTNSFIYNPNSIYLKNNPGMEFPFRACDTGNGDCAAYTSGWWAGGVPGSYSGNCPANTSCSRSVSWRPNISVVNYNAVQNPYSSNKFQVVINASSAESYRCSGNAANGWTVGDETWVRCDRSQVNDRLTVYMNEVPTGAITSPVPGATCANVAGVNTCTATMTGGQSTTFNLFGADYAGDAYNLGGIGIYYYLDGAWVGGLTNASANWIACANNDACSGTITWTAPIDYAASHTYTIVPSVYDNSTWSGIVGAGGNPGCWGLSNSWERCNRNGYAASNTVYRIIVTPPSTNISLTALPTASVVNCTAPLTSVLGYTPTATVTANATVSRVATGLLNPLSIIGVQGPTTSFTINSLNAPNAASKTWATCIRNPNTGLTYPVVANVASVPVPASGLTAPFSPLQVGIEMNEIPTASLSISTPSTCVGSVCTATVTGNTSVGFSMSMSDTVGDAYNLAGGQLMMSVDGGLPAQVGWLACANTDSCIGTSAWVAPIDFLASHTYTFYSNVYDNSQWSGPYLGTGYCTGNTSPVWNQCNRNAYAAALEKYVITVTPPSYNIPMTAVPSASITNSSGNPVCYQGTTTLPVGYNANASLTAVASVSATASANLLPLLTISGVRGPTTQITVNGLGTPNASTTAQVSCIKDPNTGNVYMVSGNAAAVPIGASGLTAPFSPLQVGIRINDVAAWITSMGGDVYSGGATSQAVPVVPLGTFDAYLIDNPSPASPGYLFSSATSTVTVQGTATNRISQGGGYINGLSQSPWQSTYLQSIPTSVTGTRSNTFSFGALNPNTTYFTTVASLNALISGCAATTCTYSVTGGGVVVLYVSGGGTLNITKNIVSTGGRLIFVTSGPVTFASTIGYNNAVTPITPATSPSNFQAGLITVGSTATDLITFSTAGTPTPTDYSFIFDGPLISKMGVKVPRNLGPSLNAYPALVNRYNDSYYYYQLTTKERGLVTPNYNGLFQNHVTIY